MRRIQQDIDALLSRRRCFDGKKARDAGARVVMITMGGMTAAGMLLLGICVTTEVLPRFLVTVLRTPWGLGRGLTGRDG